MHSQEAGRGSRTQIRALQPEMWLPQMESYLLQPALALSLILNEHLTLNWVAVLTVWSRSSHEQVWTNGETLSFKVCMRRKQQESYRTTNPQPHRDRAQHRLHSSAHADWREALPLPNTVVWFQYPYVQNLLRPEPSSASSAQGLIRSSEGGFGLQTALLNSTNFHTE